MYRIVQHAVVDGATGQRHVELARYDVVGEGGRRLNEEPLSARSAERFVRGLPRAPTTRPEGDIMPNQNDGVDAVIKWRKTGGGSFRMAGGRIIKPNQVFSARPSEIPQGFRDVVVPIDDLPEERPLEVVPGNYTIRSRGPSWFDVIDAQGKAVNEKALRLAEANALVESLQA